MEETFHDFILKKAAGAANWRSGTRIWQTLWMPGQAAVRDEGIYQDFGGDQELQGLNAAILNGLSRKIQVGVKYTEDDVKK